MVIAKFFFALYGDTKRSHHILGRGNGSLDSLGSHLCQNITEAIVTGAGQQLGDGVTIQDCGPSCWPAPFGMVLTVLIAVLMSVCIVVTTFGNLLVIVSFAVDRQIRQPTNYFICSLAVTDVLIGTVSMPFYTVRTENKIYSQSRDMLVSLGVCACWLLA